ncbi:hypothetical protein MMC31_006095 [Peltigera leucophlebia]|nr:hypothetical protein [Peltigera leucophlebia]
MPERSSLGTDSPERGLSDGSRYSNEAESIVNPRKKRSRDESDDGEVEQQSEREGSDQEPVPSKAAKTSQEETASPPLPLESPPQQDDGWDPVWDDTAQAFYFYNRFTGASQWTNPRVPDAQPLVPGVGNYDRMPPDPSLPAASAALTEEQQATPAPRPHGGYDPAIHGDYDPTAPYAQEPTLDPLTASTNPDPSAIYTATGQFNRFTGKWQAATLTPETHNDENKSKRQMSAFFDVDAAANSHNGKSLKAERSGKKLTKQELKAFKEKRKERKEEKRRAWLRD